MQTTNDGVHIHIENKKIGSLFFWYIWIMYAIVYMTKYCFSAALAPIVESGILTKSQTGLISASFHFVYAPLQIIGGIFADKYNPERMIKFGLGGSALANLVIFFNQNYYVMLFAWMFNAAVQFAIWPSVFKIISSQLPRSEKSANVFFISFSSPFGLLLSYAVAVVLPSWEYNFVISAIVLLVLMIASHFIFKDVDRFMIPDKTYNPDSKDSSASRSISLSSLLWKSGVCFLVVVAFVRMVIGQGSQTLTPVMLMESYDSVSSTTGNALNIIVIIAGALGPLAIKFFLYPRIIKNEILALCLLFALAVPLTIITKSLGDAPYIAIVASMCGISFLSTAANLLISYYNSRFSVFGKDGLISGIFNSVASIAIIVQTYGLNVMADNFGWKSVSDLWILITILSVILLLVTLPLFKKFKKDHDIK